MKYFLIIILTLFTISCGDEGSSGSSEESNTDNTDNTDNTYVNNWVFPYFDTVYLASHGLGDFFTLSDYSLWWITGESNSTYSQSVGINEISIHSETSSIPDPVDGYRASYFMITSDSPTNVFVEPFLNLSIFKIDNIYITSPRIGDLIAFSDDSLWLLTGDTSSMYGAEVGNSEIVIYSDISSIPEPVDGHRSDFFMYIGSSNPSFFIEPLIDVNVLKKASSIFTAQKSGDVITLSDNTLWLLTGDTSSMHGVSTGKQNVTIYSETSSIPDPVIGSRSSYFMYIEGSNPSFFVEPL